MVDAFYIEEGDRFVATPWTRGPWDPGAQHGGPPAALAGRAIEGLPPGAEMQTARFTLELFRPIPVAPLRVEAEVVRPGKRVQYAEARLFDDQGEVGRAAAWRIRPSDREVLESGLEATPWPAPYDGEPKPVFDPWGGPSYFTALEWRFVKGSFLEPGPAVAWMRMRVPLVAGEVPSPLTRVLAVADSGNGVSSVVAPEEFLFVNTELTVHLFQLPAGEWVCLDAVSRIDSTGIGVAESVLWDEHGRIGSARQTLLVARRDAR